MAREPGSMRYWAPVVLAVLALAGCGQSENRAAVRATTERFLTAQQAGDGAAACATLSSDTRKTLERDKSRPCPHAVGALQVDGGAVVRVDVEVTNAKVDLASGESLFLSEQAAGWRISALGCRPDGPPTDVPFECELEA